MKSARAEARQTLAAEQSAQRVEELHQLVALLAEQIAALQAQIRELVDRTPAPPAQPAKQ